MTPFFKAFLGAIVFALVVVACAIMVSGCTFVHGFTQMDDRWCAKHPEASEWRCWK